MTDYWEDLEAPRTWGKAELFNYVMNYIDSTISGEESDVDYWSNLSLPLRQSKELRFNFIMNHIDESLEEE
ncbi:MAG: hypothetical protein IJH63_00320 [Methanobrevibacter sp.]|nr:hypothetical protein [Methanosphaera sp.]MBR0369148.1 hypothetical protein [Methanobrevibacter sp.]